MTVRMGAGEFRFVMTILAKIVKFAPVQRAARYVNTARKRPACFPFRVLYRCALPGLRRLRRMKLTAS
ncbi:hypothetical protein D9M72_563440 [compost metagenome]